MSTPILEVRDVSIRFGGVEALKHVSLRSEEHTSELQSPA